MNYGELPDQLNDILNFMLESTEDLIAIIDQDLNYQWINEDNFEEILGYTNNEVIGTYAPDMIHPDDRNYVFDMFKNINQTSTKEVQLELRIMHKNGFFKWFDSKSLNYLDSHEKPKIFVIFRDLTEKKKLEKKLKSTADKFLNLLNNSSDIVIVINENNKIETIHSGLFKDPLNYLEQEMIGRNWLDFIHPKEQEKLLNKFKKGFHKNFYEVQVLNKRGEFVDLDIRGASFKDENNKRKTLIVARDISKRKQVEKLLISSKEKRDLSYDKMLFYKDLLSHDINNILQSILTITELILLMEEKHEKSNEIQEYLENIKLQVQRGARLVSNLKILSDIEETTPLLRKTEVIHVLEKSIKSANKIYGNSLKIQIETEEPQYYIFANELLEIVFENIIKNAIEHNDNEKIELNIRASIEQIENRNFLIMEFQDNGTGIDDSIKKEIFSRNTRKQKNEKFIGLGLTLVKKIMDTYKGTIRVKDLKKGNKTIGSNFILLIPLI
ncbi:MAG: PAS domain-containing sensor histidine kinase [Candidatus Lokiarchaeota archaeon]|nr:PAS domain-containing sensor histidine kinase [Candidatus Lokiarchaeota archaeon]